MFVFREEGAGEDGKRREGRVGRDQGEDDRDRPSGSQLILVKISKWFKVKLRHLRGGVERDE